MLTLEPLQENAVWRPELHPRDRLGRFRDVFKSILKLATGQWMDLDKVIGDAPNIESAFVWRTKDGWELRGSTKTGTYGIKVTPEDLQTNEHELEDRLQALNETDPFTGTNKCGCGCGAPAKSTYLPGHDARHKGNLTKAAAFGDQKALQTLESKGWGKFYTKMPAKSKPHTEDHVSTPEANEDWEPEGTVPSQPASDPNVSSGKGGLPPDMLHDDPDLAKPWIIDNDININVDETSNEDLSAYLHGGDPAPDTSWSPFDQEHKPEPELDDQVSELESQLSPEELPDQGEMELDDYLQELEDKVADKKEKQALETYDPDGGFVDDVTTAEAADVDDEYSDVEPYPDLPTCNCGCGGVKSAKARYLPGHDSRHKSALVKAAKAGDVRAYKTLEVKGWLKFLDKSKDTGEKAPKAVKAGKQYSEEELAYDPSRVPVGLPISADVYPNHRIFDPGPGTREEQLGRLKERREAATSLVDRQMLNEAMFRIRGGHESSTGLFEPFSKSEQMKRVVGIGVWLAKRGYFLNPNYYMAGDNQKVNWAVFGQDVKLELQKKLRSKAGRAEVYAEAEALVQSVNNNDLPSEANRRWLRGFFEDRYNSTELTPFAGDGNSSLVEWRPLTQLVNGLRGAYGTDDSVDWDERYDPNYFLSSYAKELHKRHDTGDLTALPELEAMIDRHSINDSYREMLRMALEDQNGAYFWTRARALFNKDLSAGGVLFKKWWEEFGRDLIDRAPVRTIPEANATWNNNTFRTHGLSSAFASAVQERTIDDSGDEKALLSTASMHDVTFEDQVIDDDWDNDLFASDAPDRGKAIILRNSPFEDHHIMVHGDAVKPFTGTTTAIKWDTVPVEAGNLRPGDLYVMPGEIEPRRVVNISVPTFISGYIHVYHMGFNDDDAANAILQQFKNTTPIQRLRTKPRRVELKMGPGLLHDGVVIKFDLDKIESTPGMSIKFASNSAVDAPLPNKAHSYQLKNVVINDDPESDERRARGIIRSSSASQEWSFDLRWKPEYLDDPVEDSPLLLRIPIVPEFEQTAADKPTVSIRAKIDKTKNFEIMAKMQQLGAVERKGTWDRQKSPSYGSWAGDKVGVAEKQATSLQIDVEDGKIVEFVPDPKPSGKISKPTAILQNDAENRKAGKEWLDKLRAESPDLVMSTIRVPAKASATSSYGYDLTLARVLYNPNNRRIVAYFQDNVSPELVLIDTDGNPITNTVADLRDMLTEQIDRLNNDNGHPAVLALGDFYQYGLGHDGQKSGKLFFRQHRNDYGKYKKTAEEAFGKTNEDLKYWVRDNLLSHPDILVDSINEVREVTQKPGGSKYGSYAKFGAFLLGKNGAIKPNEESAPTVSGTDMTGFAKNVSSQKRRFRMHGFTPRQAVEWLRDNLGTEVEERVPFRQIFRGQRHLGPLALLHDDYADGTIKPDLGDRGVVHRTAGGANALEGIVTAGGLTSISEKAERRKVAEGRFLTSGSHGTSELGDVGSGLDDHVFMNLGHGVTYLSGDIFLVYRTETAMRKGSLITNDDFGGSHDRNPKYRNYMAKWGDDFDEGARPESIASPERLNANNFASGSNELNLKYEAPAEDIGAIIMAPHYAENEQVKRALEKLRQKNPDVEVIHTSDYWSEVRAWLNKHNLATGFRREIGGTGAGIRVNSTYQVGTKVLVNPTLVSRMMREFYPAETSNIFHNIGPGVLSDKSVELEVTEVLPSGHLMLTWKPGGVGMSNYDLDFIQLLNGELGVPPHAIQWADQPAVPVSKIKE